MFIEKGIKLLISGQIQIKLFSLSIMNNTFNAQTINQESILIKGL